MVSYIIQQEPYWVDLIWLPILIVGAAAATLIGMKLSWTRWSKARTVTPQVRPLATQDILDIYGPRTSWKMHRQLPNVDNLMHRKAEPPTTKLPHIPTVCKTCAVADVKMLSSGVCLQCGVELKLAGSLTLAELQDLLVWCRGQAEEFRSKRNLAYQFRWDRTIGKVQARIGLEMVDTQHELSAS